ncbi:HlyD family efflux transporter periplasmic adaptor subunit [Paraneptunicella aestuarii]|uniref:efflux RND transporter periplasmic adaptor subunit n=1 Tax=Paraneptunicella aestuarii TaxID=2831148 RepID=UPI001E60723F|nr:HlyD family efflux transporter periplasmic adaptor subunit [Paraneptunicella aestuarii]UAA39983.1 HlyD family efflux transporter periplasmic adaptor subunit [Paraneptunicella aestuarii]
MDVIKTPQQNKYKLSKRYLLVSAASIVVLALFIWAKGIASTASIQRSDILIEKVMKGDLNVIINGYGTLRSDKQQLITSSSRATVKEIVLKPGAPVTADSVIVRMENPELTQEVESARMQLTQIQANLRQLKLSNKREMLSETMHLAEIKANWEKAKLNRAAKSKLNEKGIVSDINLQEAILEEQQLQEQLNILKEGIEQLTLVHEESVNIELEKVKQQEGLLETKQTRLNDLVVRAGIDGVLQSLSVEQGQSLDIGQEIALIGSTTDLVALIRVPQSQAQDVSIGQKVVISTRRDNIDGMVSRIDPIVEDNTVIIEVSLPDDLPSSVRPQLNVDATIIADTLANVTYIKRPAKVQPHSSVDLYRIDPEDRTADIQNIRFGRRAGDYMEIVAGAKANEQFIVSDLSNLKGTTSLDIKF